MAKPGLPNPRIKAAEAIERLEREVRELEYPKASDSKFIEKMNDINNVLARLQNARDRKEGLKAKYQNRHEINHLI